MTGIEVLLELLAAAGVRYLFGNPGSTELPLNAAVARDSRFRYIFGLHELPLTAMADGYAMASGQLGVVVLHIGVGLGNAMGMLYNAYREGTPLLFLVGQQDRRLQFQEPAMAADLVAIARPWTRWAAEIQRVEDLPQAVRRAIQTALTPPTGPVLLALPVDLQLEPAPAPDLTPPRPPDHRLRPSLAALEAAAQQLALARQPAILAGSRVTEAGAIAPLTYLAELLGAPVFAEMQTSHGRLPIPPAHPLYAGALPLQAPQLRQQLAGFDRVLVVGMNLLRLLVYDDPPGPWPDSTALIQLDCNPWEVGKNYPVEIALLGDLQTALQELSQAVANRLSAEQQQAAAARQARYATRRAATQQALRAEIAAQWEHRPLTPLACMGALARALPPEAAVVQEAATTHRDVLEQLAVLRDPAAYFAHRGWGLGWGIGCAIGVKLAWPERPVVALLGDGATLYGLQGLWTAAHHRLPVLFVIANNAQYQILKVNAARLPLTIPDWSTVPGIALTDPPIDFVSLAQALGVAAYRVTTADELSARVKEALQHPAPFLLEVPLAPG